MNIKKIRCAIYTRKSTDEGLDKNYNTLEAQYDACDNFIKSRKYEGWEVIPVHYDDGGFSGGNMKRPALKRLLEDINNNLVDMIVVYKIDRLTRSLIDFSKLIDTLDKHNCSFVSVTQQFNTADSTGRLMLNVLLSFAQFEREISSERIKDKVAASKKKGMWMGGIVPLGYYVKDRKLLVDYDEAKLVREIFDTYISCKSEIKTCHIINDRGYRSKSHIDKNGIEIGKRRFNHSLLNTILRNPIYIGKIRYKKELYEGQHESIIPNSIWEKVQKIKDENLKNKFGRTSLKHNLLKGLVECGYCGRSMTPSSSKKGKTYYDYYTCNREMKEGYDSCKAPSIPAGELDSFVINKLKMLFKNPEVLQEVIKQVKQYDSQFEDEFILRKLKSVDKMFAFFEPETIRELIKSVVKKVTVSKNLITIQYNSFGLSLINASDKTPEKGYNDKFMEFNYPISLKSKRRRVLITTPDDCQRESGEIDEEMLNAICRAFRWNEIATSRGLTMTSLAKIEQIDRSYLCKVVRLTTLAPDIIEAILNGLQPRDLRVQDLIRNGIPTLWEEQRRKFGFPPIIRV